MYLTVKCELDCYFVMSNVGQDHVVLDFIRITDVSYGLMQTVTVAEL